MIIATIRVMAISDFNELAVTMYDASVRYRL